MSARFAAFFKMNIFAVLDCYQLFADFYQRFW